MVEFRKVFVEKIGAGKGDVIRMFLQQKGPFQYKGVNSVEEADIVCLLGGSDVNPFLYGETPLVGISFDTQRDKYNQQLLDEAVRLNKFCVGICRGSQMINVYNGGMLWQDINCHALGCKHDAIDEETGEILKVTSTHHQESRLAPDGKLLMFAKLATMKRRYGAIVSRSLDPNMKDTEAYYYPKTRMFGYQPHPEWVVYGDRCQTKFFDYIDRFFPLKVGEFHEIKTEIGKVG